MVRGERESHEYRREGADNAIKSIMEVFPFGLMWVGLLTTWNSPRVLKILCSLLIIGWLGLQKSTLKSPNIIKLRYKLESMLCKYNNKSSRIAEVNWASE